MNKPTKLGERTLPKANSISILFSGKRENDWVRYCLGTMVSEEPESNRTVRLDDTSEVSESVCVAGDEMKKKILLFSHMPFFKSQWLLRRI